MNKQPTEGLARVTLDEKEGPPVASFLIEEGLLTPFQQKMISAGKEEELRLGPYRLLDELGTGGFGRVYKAEHLIMNRVVALKIIGTKLMETSDAEHWFLREARASTRLTHPNVATAYDANVLDGKFFLALEYVDGQDLGQLVEERGPLPIPFVLRVLKETALALQCAHEHGMVHRDIKPANLLLPRAAIRDLLDGAPNAAHSDVLVKVVDFGLARLFPPGTPNSSTINRNKGVIGTPFYIAPEQAHDVHDADIRSDLYSLGCVIYFALTGKVPFPGRDLADIVAQHVVKDPKPLEQLRADVPMALTAAVRKMMAKKREHRFQSPAELLDSLAFSLAPFASTITPSKPASAPPQSVSSEAQRAEASEVVALRDHEDERVEKPAKTTAQSQAPDKGVLTPGPECDALFSLWRQWSSVIDAVAGKIPYHLSDEAYRSLHTSVLAAIRACPSDEQLGGKDALSRLEALVEPWLTLKTLRDLDRATRSSVQQKCQHIEKLLFPCPVQPTFLSWPVVLVGLCSIALLFFFLSKLFVGRIFP